MRRILLFLALPLLACSAASVASAGGPQDKPAEAPASPKALLKKVVEWQGGRKSLDAVRYVSIKALDITVHGADGTNEAKVRRLRYQLAHEDEPARLTFKLDAAGSSRTFGLDGRRYWLRKPQFEQFLSEETKEGAADIEKMRDALDVLSTLFVTSLMKDGDPFEWRGRTRGAASDGAFQHLFTKKDRQGRRLTLVVRPDGTIVRASREKKFPSKDRQGKPTFVKADVVVIPSEFVEVDPPEDAGENAGKIRLPKKVEIQVNAKPWITVRMPDEQPFSFKTVPAKYFKLRRK
jgi:hypothetical protein